jgi:hypothetical protein
MTGEAAVFPLSQESNKINSNHAHLFNRLLNSKLLFRQPARLERPYSWVDHIPSAFFLTEIIEPNIIVELGVHSGNSFNSFCQAVDALALHTKVYGVDTWEGDQHAGEYAGSQILERLDRYTQERYAGFANLMKMTFNDALEYFSDGSIDLLHIDGYHTYEAAAEDFYAWLPKMSSRGVVLLHDTAVRRADFGVWRLLEELSSKFSVTEFNYGFGLGLVLTGEDPPALIQDLIQTNQQSSLFRDLWESLGRGLRLGAEAVDAQKEINVLRALKNTAASTCVFFVKSYLSPEVVASCGEFSLTGDCRAHYFEYLFAQSDLEVQKVVVGINEKGIFSHYGIEVLDEAGKPIEDFILVGGIKRTPTSFIFSAKSEPLFFLVFNEPKKISAIRGHGSFIPLVDSEVYEAELKIANSFNELVELKQKDLTFNNLQSNLRVAQEQTVALLTALSSWQDRLLNHGKLLERHITGTVESDLELNAIRTQLSTVVNQMLDVESISTRLTKIENKRSGEQTVTTKSGLNAELEDKKLQIEALISEKAFQEELVKTLEFEHAAQVFLVKQVVSSRSWKITAPFRYVMSFLK